jgi:predicted hotdog family 3-hydroxylacyl-ACP dehydratase
MEPLWKMQPFIEFDDIVAWRDEVGVRKGVVYENGRVLFNDWPVRPHEQIVHEFNTEFAAQLTTPYVGTVHYPVFTNDGTTGIYLSRMNLMC